jgi:glycyl-tRNA synthetase beta chain
MQNKIDTISFLLEIGTEDLPARFLPPAIQQLRENTESILKERHIAFSHVITYCTPRRLTVIVDGLPLMQDDRSKEVFGPPKRVAFDNNGNPTRSAIGFAQSKGVAVENLIIKKKDKGEYVVAVIEEQGVSLKKLLPEILERILFSLHFTKSMRWGNSKIRFLRPIRWLMAITDKEIINFEIDGIKTSNITRGHRFLSPAFFKVTNIASYKKLLINNCVIVDHEERRKIIIEKMEKILASTGEKPVFDEDLLNNVVNLVEYPIPVLGTFYPEYLSLPIRNILACQRNFS